MKSLTNFEAEVLDHTFKRTIKSKRMEQNPVESYLRNELIDGMEQNKKGDIIIPFTNADSNNIQIVSAHAGAGEPDMEDKLLYSEYVHWPQEWIKEIVRYCQAQNIEPLQLISQHKYWQTEAIKRLEEATRK